MPNEPVLTAGTIAGLVSALIVMAVALGWINLVEEQQQAIMGVVALASPIIAAAIARSRVTPVK